MRVRQTRLAPPAARLRVRPVTFARVALASFACFVCHGASPAQQQREVPKPTRFFSVEGRVSLPDERSAANVRVTITGRGGISRVALTVDSGRYEFRELPAGVYTVAAESITEPAYASGPAEADTAYAGTGRLTVNLSLRAPAGTPGGAAARKPGTLSAAEATQRVPKEARRAYERGVKLRREGGADEALASLTRAVESFPDYFQALSERGDLRVSRRELPAAAADFERALRANARYEPALRGAGYCKLEARDFARAADYLERAAAADPTRAGTHLLLGAALLGLERRDEARRSLQQALKIDPAGASRAHIHLANLYARERRYKEAADELRLYLETAVADPEAAEMRKVEARWRALAKEQ